MVRTKSDDPKEDLDDYLRSKEYKTYIDKLKKVKLEPVKDPWTTLSSKGKPSLKTNTILDELFGTGGGIIAGKLMEIYGAFASGKSQTIYSFIAEATQKGTVILIDSEYTWSADRQSQICEARGLDLDLLKKNLIIYQPEDFEEQLAKLLTLPSPIDLENEDRPPLQLIAVDSLIALVDDSRSFRGRDKLPIRAGIIRDMLRSLRNVARAHQCVVVFTNQVSSIPDVTKWTPAYKREQGTGGNVTRHKPDIIIYFRKGSDPIRIARLMDSSELPPMERVFQINNKGIDDVDDSIKKRYSKKKPKKEKEVKE